MLFMLYKVTTILYYSVTAAIQATNNMPTFTIMILLVIYFNIPLSFGRRTFVAAML